MRGSMTPEAAEILALEALGWLAGDADAFARFLALSGVDPAGLRAAAESRDTGVAILDFLLSDEALLLRFCEEAGVGPAAPRRARQLLGGDG
jgi:hypothetical protein